MSERFMSKAHLFINGYSLKNRCNVEHDLLRHPHRAGLETSLGKALIKENGFSIVEINNAA